MTKYTLGTLSLRPEQRVVLLGTEILPLAPKTFDLFLLLVESAGDVVSREILRERVWPDSFTEEAVISRSISLLRSKLRPYLGDGVIETVPKRGYRYIGPVEIGSDALEAEPPSPPTSTQEQASLAPLPAVLAAAQISAAPRWGRGALLLALAAVVPMAVVAALHRHTVRAAVPVRPSLAVLSLRNLSGQDSTAWLSIALQGSMGTELALDRGARVAEPERTSAAERDLALRASHALTSDEASNVGRRLGTDLVLSGSYLDLQDTVRLDLVLYRAQDGRLQDRWSDTVPQTHLDDLVGAANAHFRQTLQLPPLQGKPSLPFLTSDQAAAHFYAEGVRLARTGDHTTEAAEAFEHTIQADPGFAQAHAALSLALTKLGDGEAADREAHLALATSAHLPTEQRLLLRATACSQLTDYEGAIAALSQLQRIDAENPEYTLRLAQALTNAGQLDRATSTLLPLVNTKTAAVDARVPLAMAEVSSHRGDEKSILLYAGQAQKLAQAEGSRSEEAQALVTSGIAWSALGDSGRAVADLQQAEALYTSVADRTGIVSVLMAKAGVAQGHDFPDAPAIAQRALEAAEQTREPAFVAHALLLVANVQLVRDQEAAAASSYEKVIALANSVHDEGAALAALSNLGTAEIGLHLSESAETHTMQALELARSRGVQRQVARCTQQLAELELAHAEFAPAEAHFHESVTLWKQLGATLQANDVQFEIGDMLLTEGRLPEAHTAFASVDANTMSRGDITLMRIDQARLTAAEGNVPLGERMAAEALRTANSADYALNALDVLAELQLRQRDLTALRTTLADMSAKLKLTPADKDEQQTLTFWQARLEMATGQAALAERSLKMLLHDKFASKDREMMLRVRLALAEIADRNHRSSAATQAALRDARSQGFGLLAQSAS